jgi:hypothetical protein
VTSVTMNSKTAQMSTANPSTFTLDLSQFERRLIGVLAGMFLLTWLIACVTDVNYPPHARIVRLITALGLLLLGVLEIRYPWSGFKTFLLLWTQGAVLREVLTLYISSAFASMPTFWGGPVAATLVLAYIWRTRVANENIIYSNDAMEGPDRWIQTLQWGFWGLTAAWVASAIFSSIRLINPPPEWHLGNGWRCFLTPGMSAWTPLQSTIDTVPPLLLGLVLLNRSSWMRDKRGRSLSTALLTCACIGLAIPATEVLFCYYRNFAFSFDNVPPSGPFGNRNAAGPVCVLASVLAVLLVIRSSVNHMRIVWTTVSGMSLLAAYHTLSRNAYFLVLCALLVAFFYRPFKRRLAAMVFLAVTFAALVYAMPLPTQEFIQMHPALGRMISTVADIRKGQFDSLSSNRIGLWVTAWHIFMHYPLIGAGPGTFGMLAYPGSPLGSSFSIDAYLSAHSIPLNILAECGLVGATAWCVIWLFGPMVKLVKANFNPWTNITLLIGLANIFDTVWLVPGVATFACCAAAFTVIRD